MRTLTQKWNALIAALSAALGVPVLLASQVEPEAEPPFIVWAVLNDYTPDGGLGDYSSTPDGDEAVVSTRTEQPTATLSFTACSINRTATPAGGPPVYILGADEAHDLAEKAQGFFLHTGRYDIQAAGFVVVDVSNAASRDALELDEMGRRFGFDVRLRYIRTDAMKVQTVATARATQNKEE